MRRRPQRFPETWNPRGPLPGHCGYRVNPEHWAAGYCLGVWLLGRGTPQNLVTGEIAVRQNSPQARVGVTGPCYYGVDTNDGWRVRAGNVVNNRSTWTIVSIVAQPVGTALFSSGRVIYAERHPSTGNDITKLHQGETNGWLGFVYRNTAGNLRITNGTGDIRTARPVVAALSLTPGGSSGSAGRVFGLYQDGGLLASHDWGTTSTAQTQVSHATIGYDARSASNDWIGEIAMTAVFSLGFTAEQHAEFARAPYRLLIPEG